MKLPFVLVILKIFFTNASHADAKTQANKFVFISEPATTIASDDEKITFDCQLGVKTLKYDNVAKITPSKVTWFADDEMLDDGFVLHENYSVTIDASSAMAGKTFRCVAELPHGVAFSSGEGKIVKVPSTFPDVPEVTTMVIGGVARIACGNLESSFWRPMSVSWFKNGMLVGSSDDTAGDRTGAFVLNDGSLQVVGATANEEGVYQCKIKLRGMRTKTSRKMKLQLARNVTAENEEELEEKITKVWVSEGKVLRVHCPDSLATDGFVWTRDQYADHKKLSAGSVLVVRNVTAKDAGKYQCTNTRSWQVRSVEVVVFSLPNRTTSSTPDVYKVKSGGLLVVPCQYWGTPAPRVRWYRNGRMLEETSSDLVIRKDAEQQGYYQCLACNEVGCSHHNVLLNPTNILPVEKPNSVEVSEFSKKSFSITWKTSQSKVSYLVAVTDDRHNTVMAYAAASGNNVTINDFGLTSKFYKATVSACSIDYSRCSEESSSKAIEVPSQKDFKSEMFCKVESVTALTAQAYCFENAQKPSSTINWVAYKWLIKSSKNVIGHETTSKNYRINNLEPSTTYELKVARKSDKKFVGDFSESLNFTTEDLPTSISAAPKNVAVLPANLSTINVQWDEVDAEKISGYKISMRERFSKKRATFQTGPDVFNYTIFDVEPNKEYSIRVQAFNEAGIGPVSSKVIHSTSTMDDLQRQVADHLEKPDVYRKTTDASSITLKWRAPKNPSIVTGYKIHWGELSPNEHQQELGKTSRWYRITQLNPNTVYRISIQALSGEQQPSPSLMMEVKTQQEKRHQPDKLFPPLGVAIEVISATSLNVSWGNHNLHEKEEKGFYYKIKCKTNANVQHPKTLYYNTTVRYFVVKNLQPHTFYELSVCAVFGKQVSDWSMIDTAKTLESKPTSPPQHLTVVPFEKDSTLIRLNWQPPENPNGRLNGYLVHYTKDASQDISSWLLAPVVGDALTATIKNLQPNSHYYFKVQARNEKGVGPNSGSVHWSTLKANSNQYDESVKQSTSKSLFTENIYIIVGAVVLVFLIIVVFATVAVFCNHKLPKSPFKSCRKSSSKRKIKYAQPNYELRVTSDLETRTTIFKTPTNSSGGRMSNGNGVASNSWSRTTLYNGGSGGNSILYDGRMESFDMVPNSLKQNYERTFLSKDAFSSYQPHSQQYDSQLQSNDTFVGRGDDSAYGSDHPQVLANNHDDVVASQYYDQLGSRNAHNSSQKVGRFEKGATGERRVQEELNDVVDFVEGMRLTSEHL